MQFKSCPVCKSKKRKLIWNDLLRSGKNIWTKKPYKIYWCQNCDLRYLEKFNYSLQNNKVFRKLYDGSNSIKKYNSFNKNREKYKLDKIKKIINFKNKEILESNCGAATNLDFLKKEAKQTYGLDHHVYKSHVEKKHIFFTSLNEINKNKYTFDIILSLAEIEHQTNVIKFVNSLKKILKKNGLIVFRIPNYNNIYLQLLGNKFQTFDFRTSHNYYFSEKSCDFLFKKLNLKVIHKNGLQEYSVNHLIEFIKKGKRVAKYPKLINKKISDQISKHIETNKISTSLTYILKSY